MNQIIPFFERIDPVWAALLAMRNAVVIDLVTQIRAELDAMSFSRSDPRRAHNDPIWNEPPHPFQQGSRS